MDLQGIINDAQMGGGAIYANPNHTKSKKNPQSKFITAATPQEILDHDRSLNDLYGDRQAKIQENISYMEPYVDDMKNYGATPNTAIEDIDETMAKLQPGLKKLGSALSRTLVSEIAIGTIKSVPDVLDALGQATGIIDEHDYTNAVSGFFENLQEDFERKYAPVFATPGVDISNGGLTDFGWYAQNIPSIASSVTMLLPSMAGAKILKSLATATKLSAATRATIRATTRAIGNAKLHRAANKMLTVERANRALEIGTTALISRTIENYQEGRGVYKDMYKDASEYLNNATPEMYNEVIQKNKNILDGVDLSDRDAVARKIAATGADHDFKMNYLNTIWDVVQLYALRNMLGSKSLSREVDSPAIRRAQRNSIRYAGKTDEEIAALEKARSFRSKAGERILDYAIGSKNAVVAELSEGFEEGWNYISQMEGMHLGNLMLGKDKPSSFDSRVGSYFRSPQLYESAIWGVVGGVVFNAAGSRIKRAWNTVEERSKLKKATKRKEKTGEETPEVGWKGLSLLPEVKRVVTDIESRSDKAKRLGEQLKSVENGINPFDPSQKLVTEEEKEVARLQLKKMYAADLTLSSLNNGTFEMTKEYLADDRVRQAMVKEGVVKEEDSRQWQQDMISDMDKISEMYYREVDRLNLLSSAYNGKTSMEFLQIAATDNVYHKLTTETLARKRDAALSDYNNKKETAINDGKIDGTLPYEKNMQLHARVNALYALYDQRRAIRKRYEKDKKLSDKVALDNINKIIKDRQKKLYRETLDQNLTDTLFAMLNVYARNKEQGEIDADIRAMIEDATQGKFEKFEELFGVLDESKKPKTADEIVQMNQDFNKRGELYRKGMAEIESIDGARDDYERAVNLDMAIEIEKTQIIGNREEFKNYMTVQNNTMSEARKAALDKSYDTIKEMSKKYGFGTIDAYMDALINGNRKLQEDQRFKAISEEDRKTISDAVDVLNFSDIPNEQVRETLVGMMRAAKLAEESEEKTANEESLSNNNNPTPPPAPPTNPTNPINPTTPANPAPAPSNQASQTNQTNQTSQNTNSNETTQPSTEESAENTEESNRIIADYAKVRISKAGNLYMNVNGKANYRESVPVYITETDGEYELDVESSNREDLFTSDELFDSGDGVSVIDGEFEVESNPIIARKKNGRGYEVVHKGKLVNRNNVVEQQSEAAGNEEFGEENQQNSRPVRENANTAEPGSPAINAEENNAAETVSNVDSENVANAEDENGTAPVVTSNPAEDTQEPAPETEPTQSPSTGGLNGSIAVDKTSDYYIKLYRYASQVFGQSFNLHETYDDVDSALNAVAENVRTMFNNNGVDENITNSIIDDKVKSIKAAYEFLHQLKNPIQKEGVILTEAAIDEGMAARSGESGLSFSTPFVGAFESFVKEYAKVQFAPQVDGKYVISLADMMRICTANYANRKAVANAMYEAIRDYLLSPEGKNRYVVVDDNNLTNPNFIKDLGKSREQTDSKHSAQRVDIKDFMERAAAKSGEESENYFKTLNSVKAGDKLSLKKKSNAYVIEKDNVALGFIPIPKIVDGSYTMNNMGWNTDVRMANGEVQSRLKNFFTEVFTGSDNESASFRQLIMKAILSKGNIKDSLVEEFKNHSITSRAMREGFLNEKVDYATALQHLANLYRYTTTFQDGVNEYRNAALLRDSLASWFDKLYGVYDAVSNVTGEAEVEVLYMNEGEINRATDGNIMQNYTKLNYATEGLANLDGCRIAIVDPKNQNSLVASGRVYSVDNWASGSTVIAVESRNSQPDFVKAVGVTLTQNDLDNVPLMREMYANLKTEFGRLMRTALDHNINGEGNYEQDVKAIKDFLQSIVAARGTASDTGRITLFRTTRGQVYLNQTSYNGNEYIEIAISRDGKTESFKIYTQINGQPNMAVQFKSGNETQKSVGVTNSRNSSEVSSTAIDYLFNRIIKPYCNFNVSHEGIQSDSATNSKFNGFLTRTDDGKLKLRIGDYEKEFDSYNDFVIKNNLVRVNTFVGEDGSNFTPRGSNMKSNQVMYVNLPTKDKSATPVSNEEVFIDKNTNADKANEAREVLDSDTENKGRALVELMKGKESPFLQRIDELSKEFDIVDELFPHDIKYDNRLNEVRRDANGNPIWRGVIAVSASNPNARSSYRVYNNGTPSAAKFTFGEVRVGSLFLNMLASNNTDLQNEAARKLIHERLHLQLADAKVNRRYVFDEVAKIYKEFKENLDRDLANSELDENQRKRLEAIKTAIQYYKGDRLYEEFLVESLTNKDFFDYLNGITDFNYKAEDKGNKETLFNKIARFIAKLFGWNINNNSLYNEELKMLRNAFDGSSATTESQSQTVTESQSQTVAEETNQEEQSAEKAPINEDDEAINIARAFNKNAIEEEDIDDFEDTFGDGFAARSTESHIESDSGFTATSITDFINSIPSDVRDDVNNLVKDGYLNITCSL